MLSDPNLSFFLNLPPMRDDPNLVSTGISWHTICCFYVDVRRSSGVEEVSAGAPTAANPHLPPTPDHGTLTAIMFRICCRVRKERQAGRSGREHNDVCSSVLIVAHLAALLDKLNGKVHEVETARLGISCRMLATSQPEALTLVRGALCNGKSRIALNMSCVRRSVQATTAWRSRERRCGGILASAGVRVGQQAEMDHGDCWELEFSPVETGLPPPNDRNYQDNSTHPR